MENNDLNKLKIDKSNITYRKKSFSRFILPIAAVVVIIGVVILYFSGVIKPAVQVETAAVSTVYPSQTITVLNASGYVVARRKAAVSSKITGRLEWIGVEEGSLVKAGDVIARLENRDLAANRELAAANLETIRANREVARTELNDASITLKRSTELLNSGIVSKAEYDTANARYNKAKSGVLAADASVKSAAATVKSSDIALEYSLIRAPFDAVVLTKNADIGDIITPLGAAANAKAAVVTIADPLSLEVEADVSESNISKIKRGAPCEITLDALPDSRFAGFVHSIVPTADRAKSTVMIKVRFASHDSRILPEMSAKTAVLSRSLAANENRAKKAIPLAAIISRNGKKFVYLVSGEKIVEHEVTIVGNVGELVEVSGLKPGEKIAIKPLEKLRNGTKIKTGDN